ncbi:flagellar motor protein MotB [Pseudemcibacter aquimaris]|uniref:flagellar motor protein MotB n=1 Tax=Pseudemcibacter aquimaris TaxID=2857064 RepID=UPI002010F6E0|nr:flagellar motor protein MotB [Pseudemcibacter aquimaris]MCC3860588.1 flagellar motor protein MotB [Pseudemcibacter aquimaris]WDU59409.1 flagellar motor protein MotB [Pseudemcibacter aquimaris]
MSDDQQQRPIIVKRIKKVDGGAHGGAWKVAYADFVTAMMAFFLLLWLLNSTSKEQKEGLSDYFSPTTAATQSAAGGDGVFGGISITQQDDAIGAVTAAIPEQTAVIEEEVEVPVDEESFEEMMANREQEAFEDMAAEMNLSIQQSAELSELQDQVLIDVTEDGMRIQLVDQDNRSMFRNDTAELYSYAERMLAHISGKVNELPNRISISGHTDSVGYRAGATYSNWELSSDRAHTARRVMNSSGVSADRFAEIVGKAHTEPLLPDRPERPENRRITILVIREAPILPTNL